MWSDSFMKKSIFGHWAIVRVLIWHLNYRTTMYAQPFNSWNEKTLIIYWLISNGVFVGVACTWQWCPPMNYYCFVGVPLTHQQLNKQNRKNICGPHVIGAILPAPISLWIYPFSPPPHTISLDDVSHKRVEWSMDHDLIRFQNSSESLVDCSLKHGQSQTGKDGGAHLKNHV